MTIEEAFKLGYSAFDGKVHFLDNPFNDEEEIVFARHWVDGHIKAFKDKNG